MSRQSDLDNHANQLNAEHDAYHSSRGGSGRDDDDEGGSYHPRTLYSYAPMSTTVKRERVFEFTLVALNGQACFAKLTVAANEIGSWSQKSQVEDLGLRVHGQLQHALRQSSGASVGYALLTMDGAVLEGFPPFKPTVAGGWHRRWRSIDRSEWNWFARTRSYRNQASCARKLVDEVATQAFRHLSRLAAEASPRQGQPLSNAANAFRGVLMAPLYQVNQFWQAAVERAQALEGTPVEAVFDKSPTLEHALRALDVLVRASNWRIASWQKHPAAFDISQAPCDAYDEYFGLKTIEDGMGELEAWFGGGEEQVDAVMASQDSGRPLLRFDLGSHDFDRDGRNCHIARDKANQALQAALLPAQADSAVMA